MPGMIDAHVHVNTGGNDEAQRTLIALANAQIDLGAGFTSVLDMDSRGGYNTVDIRDEINSGRVQGPRMQVVGQSLNPRATNYYPDIRPGRFQEGHIEDKDINGPWAARAAVREAKLHGVDWVKMNTTQDFACTMHMWTPDAKLVNSPSLTFEEVQAIVDERTRSASKWRATLTAAKAWRAALMPASTRPIICSNSTRPASRLCSRISFVGSDARRPHRSGKSRIWPPRADGIRA